MAVDQYALITVEDYKAYAGISNSEIEADAISLYCSAGDATAATVVKSGTTLTLVITGGGDAGSNAIDLTLAANDTLGELAAVIEALSGWTANLAGWASATSTDLKNLGSTNVLGSANETTLIFYDNYNIERLIDRASTAIETYLNRNIKTRAYTRERYDGGGRMLFLTAYPVTAIRLVSVGQQDVIRIQNTAGKFNASVAITTTGVILTVDGTSVAEKLFADYATMTLMAAELTAQSGWTATVPDSNLGSWPSALLVENPNIFCLNEYGYLTAPDDPKDEYTVDLNTGIIEFLYIGGGFQDVFVSYTGGYTTVPYDIVMATVAMVKYYDDLSDADLALESEKLGDYSYKRGETDSVAAVNVGLSPDGMKTLQKYRRRPINP